MKESVSEVLINKSQAIALGADLLAEKTNDWMVIRDFIKNRLGEITLTEKQEEKLKRYQFIINQMSGFKHSENDIIHQLKNLFGIKAAQAYEDLSDAKKLHIYLFDINKAFELRLLLDANSVMLFKAKETNDPTYAKYEKNRIDMLKLVKEEEENPGEDFEPHTLVIQFNPVLIGADPNLDQKAVMAYINEKRGAKLNTKKLEELEVEDAGD